MELVLPPLHNGLKPVSWSSGVPQAPNGYSGQLEVFNYLFSGEAEQVTAVCAGRRFGKTRLVVLSVLYACISWKRPLNALSPETIVVVLPTMKQALKVIWPSMLEVFSKIPSATVDRSSHVIRVPNKPAIILSGAEAGHGLRGLRICFAALDEFQGFRPDIYYQVIKPAMADTAGSRALITGTPQGELNIFYEVTRSPGVKFFQYKTEENPHIPRSYIEMARRTLPPRVFQQEFEASFLLWLGQIYTEFDRDLNVFDLAPEEYDRAYIGVDWGDVHPALCVVLLRGYDFYIVEAETLGDGSNPITQPTFFAAIAAACKTWKVHRIYAPKDRPAAIQEMRVYGEINQVGAMARCVEAENSVLAGIQTVHGLFFERRLKVHRRLTRFIKEVTSYRRKQDKRTGDYLPDTVDDRQPDHAVDALRYAIYTLNVRTNGKLMQPFTLPK